MRTRRIRQQQNHPNQKAKSDQQKKNADKGNRQQAKTDLDKEKKEPSDRPEKGEGQAKKEQVKNVAKGSTTGGTSLAKSDGRGR